MFAFCIHFSTWTRLNPQRTPHKQTHTLDNSDSFRCGTITTKWLPVTWQMPWNVQQKPNQTKPIQMEWQTKVKRKKERKIATALNAANTCALHSWKLTKTKDNERSRECERIGVRACVRVISSKFYHLQNVLLYVCCALSLCDCSIVSVHSHFTLSIRDAR